MASTRRASSSTITLTALVSITGVLNKHHDPPKAAHCPQWTPSPESETATDPGRQVKRQGKSLLAKDSCGRWLRWRRARPTPSWLGLSVRDSSGQASES